MSNFFDQWVFLHPNQGNNQSLDCSKGGRCWAGDFESCHDHNFVVVVGSIQEEDRSNRHKCSTSMNGTALWKSTPSAPPPPRQGIVFLFAAAAAAPPVAAWPCVSCSLLLVGDKRMCVRVPVWMYHPLLMYVPYGGGKGALVSLSSWEVWAMPWFELVDESAYCMYIRMISTTSSSYHRCTYIWYDMNIYISVSTRSCTVHVIPCIHQSNFFSISYMLSSRGTVVGWGWRVLPVQSCHAVIFRHLEIQEYVRNYKVLSQWWQPYTKNKQEKKTARRKQPSALVPNECSSIVSMSPSRPWACGGCLGCFVGTFSFTVTLLFRPDGNNTHITHYRANAHAPPPSPSPFHYLSI